MPGLAALNTGREAEVDEMSCGSASNCVAGGYYSHGQIGERGFVTVERNGRGSPEQTRRIAEGVTRDGG